MIDGYLARQLALLRRPNGRELLPREKEYLKALEQMESEGKIPKIKVYANQLPYLTLNYGKARSVTPQLDRTPHLGRPHGKDRSGLILKSGANYRD